MVDARTILPIVPLEVEIKHYEEEADRDEHQPVPGSKDVTDDIGHYGEDEEDDGG